MIGWWLKKDEKYFSFRNYNGIYRPFIHILNGRQKLQSFKGLYVNFDSLIRKILNVSKFGLANY